MISQSTADKLRKALKEWAARNGVAPGELPALLRELSEIEGSKSFRDSVKLLLTLVEQDEGPEEET